MTAESEMKLQSDRAGPRFIRLGSSDVLVVAHASEDSRFLLVPVIDTPRITGYQAYETMTGQLLKPNAPGCRDGVWSRLYMARNWVIETYYGDEP